MWFKIINRLFGRIYGGTGRRQWHPTLVFLPGKSHGRRSLVGCSPWGHQESDTTERLHFHFSLSCTGEGNGNPLQCSCLESPRDGGAWWAAVYGVAQSRIRLKWLSSSSSMGEWGMLFNDKVPNPADPCWLGSPALGMSNCCSGERSSISEKGVGEIFWEGMERACVSMVVSISSCHCYCLTALAKDTLHTVKFTQCKYTNQWFWVNLWSCEHISSIQFWKIFSTSPNSICPYFLFATPRQLVFCFQYL